MGVLVRHLRAETKPLEIVFGSGDHESRLAIEFRPNAMTGKQQEEFEAMLEENAWNASLDTWLGTMLVAWDLYLSEEDEARGSPVDFTNPKELDEVPVEIKRKVMTAIQEDLYPNLKSAKLSSGSFSRARR